ncbi:Bug family tripartite tricarboxylate transporter substrate binding protein [Tropicimonas isoalkanivorans]|uniref:Tripartite-type tricarboxylate transporter, receptor component TctC n=1 Tax=Tropicimonas isoalkanivorans TaxID=441112 RepID=A0A1I1Q3J2_9RHOB|nr:tripartite tricarboxylate transporter substrate binding protein [Tropicimonas isoalkanivorans]SFD16585.1 Tripartite-type tricarboxylate transporter, receptor component TctC [Tropicimonas isoalkanivorans]
MTKWLAAVAGVITAVGPVFCGMAQAAEYPRRAVEMVVPFGAGGASDVFARQFSEIASKYLGAPITVVNKGGAGTIEGLAYAYSAPADGYTILEVTPSLPIVEAQNRSSIKFRAEFEPIMRVQADVQLIGVPKDSPFQTIEDLVAFGKENPKKLKIGGISPGGLDDYIAHGFAKAAGFEWNYIPYKGSSVMKAAVLGGELDVYQDKLISFMSLVESGDIRPLVVISDQRIDVPELKDAPSSVEKGIDFTQGSWRGFVVKRGTPEEIKAKIIDAFEQAYADPAYKEVEKQQMTNILPGHLASDEFETLLDEEFEHFRAMFEELGQVKK